MKHEMITILDFTNAEVHQYHLPEHLIGAQIEDVEEWLHEQEFNINNIQFMTHDVDSTIIH